MNDYKNISWKIVGFDDTFGYLKDVKKFLSKHGDVNTKYTVFKITNGQVECIQYFEKTYMKYVCEICNCIRRMKAVAVHIESEEDKTSKKIIPVTKEQTCKNPACIDYKKYLKHSEKREDFEDFETFAKGKYRTSEHDIFNVLRFMDNADKNWLINDSDKVIMKGYMKQ